MCASMTTSSSRSDRVATGWLAVCLLSLIGAILLTIVIMEKVAIPFDAPLLAAATSVGGYELLWNVLSEMGNYPMIPIGLGFVVWLWWTKHRREAVLVLLILIAATIGSEAVKALAARPRPSGPVPGIPGVVYSFPSGHAFEDVMILGMLSVRLWRSSKPHWAKLGFATLVTILVLLIGFARMALNVHYPSDVLGGYLGGLACLGWYAYGTRDGAWASRAGESLSGLHLPWTHHAPETA
jgi:undecaprenyl-diphosphatase